MKIYRILLRAIFDTLVMLKNVNNSKKGENNIMANPTIIPQKFTFEKPTITNATGKTISHGINVSIDIDAFKAEKSEIQKDLAAIFAEVLEYFD